MRPLWVATLFALFGWVSIHHGWFVFRGASEYADRLQARAEHRLDEAGHGWAEVEMRGQRAHLSGAAPTAEARDAALAVVARAAGRGGPFLGGVTRVTHEIEASEQSTRYWLEGRWDGEHVVLSGYVPQADDIDSLRTYVGTFDIDATSNGLVMAEGAPGGFSWMRAARFGVTQLLKLESGALRLERRDTLGRDAGGTPIEGELVVSGLAASEAVIEDLDIAFEAPPIELVSLEARTDVTLLGDETIVHESVSCQRVVRDVQAGEDIAFYAGSASPQPASEAWLAQIARALGACGEERIAIAVQVGSAGDPSFNTELSRRRAREVMRALIAGGVDGERLIMRDFASAADEAMERGSSQQLSSKQVLFSVVG